MKINTTYLLLTLALFFQINDAQSQITSNNSNRPNIIYIMGDDHTSQAWGIYGGVLKDFVKNKKANQLIFKNAKAIDAFNHHVAKDNRTEQVLLRIRDGLFLIRKL